MSTPDPVPNLDALYDEPTDTAEQDSLPDEVEDTWPRWFWVRLRLDDPNVIAWRRMYCDGLPFDQVEWVPDLGTPPSPAPQPSTVTRVASAPAQVVRPHRAKVELTSRDVLVDQTTGVMPRERFLALAKSRAFPAFKEGRLWIARLSDVEAWVDRQMATRPGKACTTSETEVDEAVLDEIRQKVGLRTKGRR